MLNTPKGLRLQIGFFGRRNAGKSSLLNALAGQDVSIVSDFPGTTTDPVEKAMEIPPLGPVLLIDTAGLDEASTGIGAQRAERSRRVFERCDLALLVANGSLGETESRLLEEFRKKAIPCVVVFAQCDVLRPDASLLERLKREKIDFVETSAQTGEGIGELRAALIRNAPEGFLGSTPMLGDLVAPMSPVLLITPIDKEAPKGRMILPQVQAIRDVLDHDAYCVVVRENAVEQALRDLNRLPGLAVTDSQAFGTVSQLLPPEIPLTSFSILLARMKGDLATCAAGAAKIDRLRDGDCVLVAEACSHHPIGDDIGREKLPRWIRNHAQADVKFHFASGADFPEDLSPYALVLHCGACTFNRRAVLSRILRCREQGVPFTNYGVAIAHVHGILERALAPFPSVYEEFRKARGGV